ncbi:MAG: SurA-like protein [Candidatus Acidoferrum typicum]|nr:SurA-like protein [Candidatus Acidoferrum typicum]
MSRHGSYLLAIALLALASTYGSSQELLDQIAARVDSDIILLSQLRTLSRYQMLVDGKAESDASILDRLVDQLIVRNEADTARFPHPADVEIAQGVEHLEGSFASREEYQARKRQSGLSDKEIRRMVADQLYLTNYLDSRFRPAVQVTVKQVEDFYQEAVVPRAKARSQAPPSLDASREYIQDALVQRGINEQAEIWLKESRSHLHVEKFLKETGK